MGAERSELWGENVLREALGELTRGLARVLSYRCLVGVASFQLGRVGSSRGVGERQREGARPSDLVGAFLACLALSRSFSPVSQCARKYPKFKNVHGREEVNKSIERSIMRRQADDEERTTRNRRYASCEGER